MPRRLGEERRGTGGGVMAGGPDAVMDGSDGYSRRALASWTAALKACWAGTSANSADSTAFLTTSFTSALLGTVGTMSAYFDTVSRATGRALSSIASGSALKNGSSYAASDEG